MNKFIVGTGYYNYNNDLIDDKDFFENIWLPNTLKLNPEKIVVINTSNDILPNHEKVEYINISNIMDRQNLKQKQIETKFSGWTLSFINSAMYAYSCGCDFIYKEQDCLWFGDTVNSMYNQMGSSKMITGELMDFPTEKYIIELSLMLTKNDFIPILLSKLMGIEQNDIGVRSLVIEGKFLSIRKELPEMFSVMNFGYGGNRPFDENKNIFYIQKPRWNFKERYEYKDKIKSYANEIKYLVDKKMI